MNEYQNALRQVCLQCKTQPQYCNQKTCKRHNILKKLVDEKSKSKSNWNKDHLKDYIKLFKLQDSGILQEFLDNQETIRIYLESVSD